MASFVAKKCKTPITIKYPSDTIMDGKRSFTSDSGLSLIMDYTEADVRTFGKVKNGKVFIVAPLSTAPVEDGKILHDSTEYDIKAVKIYKNGKGVVLGYRCVVVGG